MAEKYIWKKSIIDFGFVNMDTVSGLLCGISGGVFYTSSDGLEWQDHPEVISEDAEYFEGYWFPAMGDYGGNSQSVICIPYSAWDVPDGEDITLVTFHYDTGLINYSVFSVPISGTNLPEKSTEHLRMFCTLLNPLLGGTDSYLTLFGFPNFIEYNGNDNQIVMFLDEEFTIPDPGPISNEISEWESGSHSNNIFINKSFPFSSYSLYGDGSSVLFDVPVTMDDSLGATQCVLGFDFSVDTYDRLYVIDDTLAKDAVKIISYISDATNIENFIVENAEGYWICQIVAGAPNGEGSNGFQPVFSNYISKNIGHIKGVYQTSSDSDDLKIITTSGIYNNLGISDENEIVPNEFLDTNIENIQVFQNFNGGIVALLPDGDLYVRQSANQTLTTTLSYCTDDTSSLHTYTDLYPNIRLESILDYEPAGAEFLVYTTSSSAKAVRASDGKTLTATTSGGVAGISNVGYGTWTITAGSNTKTIEVREFKRYKVFATLNNYSWAEISAVSLSGDAKNLFSVGDGKAITLRGTASDLSLNITLYCYILDFDHDQSSASGTKDGITFGTFKTAAFNGIDVCLVSGYSDDSDFRMNTSDTNSGGWKNSDMRYNILGSTNTQNGDASSTTATSPVSSTLMSCLPSGLRAVMRPMYIYTDNTGGGSNTASYVTGTLDYLPLLAEYEVHGTRAYANSAEQNNQTQYAYYKNGNSKVKYKHSSTSSVINWRVRSPYYNKSNGFCLVNTGGSTAYSNAAYSYGVAPAFKV